MNETKKTEKLFQEFKDKWDKMSNKERHQTLLNMVLNIGYRMDILANVVSQLPDIKEIHDNMDKELKDILNGAPLPNKD